MIPGGILTAIDGTGFQSAEELRGGKRRQGCRAASAELQ